MTPEQKDLLIKDLCGRLPYGVKVYDTKSSANVPYMNLCHVNGITNEVFISSGMICRTAPIEDIRPYLFPLSSMTEEQKKECNFADDLDSDILDAALNTNHYHRTGIPAVTYNLVDWCIKNNFDYRGLIPMGLAEDATNLNIY